eukprot:3780559-Lingulodinium_polyedra.AAC.1
MDHQPETVGCSFLLLQDDWARRWEGACRSEAGSCPQTCLREVGQTAEETDAAPHRLQESCLGGL